MSANAGRSDRDSHASSSVRAREPRTEQHRIGRADLLATWFAMFERDIRDQLTRVLGGGGFDPARDIAAITVTPLPHGYACTYNSLTDPMDWVFTSTSERPCVIARQPFGLVSIANSDAAASPHTDAASCRQRSKRQP